MWLTKRCLDDSDATRRRVDENLENRQVVKQEQPSKADTIRKRKQRPRKNGQVRGICTRKPLASKGVRSFLTQRRGGPLHVSRGAFLLKEEYER